MREQREVYAIAMPDFDYDLENQLAERGDDQAYTDLWEYAYTRGIHTKLVQAWRVKQKKGDVGHLAQDELESEALMAIRKAIPRFKPGHGSLFRYMRMPVHEALDIFRGQSRSPVQLGQKKARALKRDLHAEEYHSTTNANPDSLEDIAQ